MRFLLDTSVLIAVRDNAPGARQAVALLSGELLVSAISLTELEGGVAAEPSQAAVRAAAIARIEQNLSCLAYGVAESRVYGQIVRETGYARRLVIDRMIAAQALVAGAALVTLNPGDFADIAGLEVLQLGEAR